MKKYYLDNGQEVRIADIIRKRGKVTLPFGTGTASTVFTVTNKNLQELIDEKIITEIEIPDKKSRRKLKNNKTDVQKVFSDLMNQYDKNTCDTTNLDSLKILTYPLDIDYYINRITTKDFFKQLEKMNKVIAMQLVLKEIAKVFDSYYKNDIMCSNHLYIISLLNGEIVELDKKKVMTTKTFSAFRSVHEANIAKYILSDYFNELFDDRKQKDKKCD